jgi:hypothetical protein
MCFLIKSRKKTIYLMTLKDKNMTGNEVWFIAPQKLHIAPKLASYNVDFSATTWWCPLSIMTQVKAIIKIEVSRLVAPLKTKGILKRVKLPRALANLML